MEMPEGLRERDGVEDSAKGRRLSVTLFDSREAIDVAEQRFEAMGEETPEDVAAGARPSTPTRSSGARTPSTATSLVCLAP